MTTALIRIRAAVDPVVPVDPVDHAKDGGFEMMQNHHGSTKNAGFLKQKKVNIVGLPGDKNAGLLQNLTLKISPKNMDFSPAKKERKWGE